MLTWYSGANHAVLYAQNDRWGLAPIETRTLVQKSLSCMQKPPIETSKSGANHAVLHAQNDRLCLAPRETSFYDANHADLHPQNDRWGLGPLQTCNSAPKVTVLHAKTTEKGWDP